MKSFEHFPDRERFSSNVIVARQARHGVGNDPIRWRVDQNARKR